MAKTAAHIRYKTSSGTIVPGVTTILNVLNKPALVKWANNLGLRGIDSSKYVDDKAAIGTLAHYMILCHLKHETPEVSDYSAKQIDMAETCLIKYRDWEKGHTLRAIIIEESLVSDSLQFGGTLDWYGGLDGVLTLLDFKTGSGIYPEMAYQLAAYKYLLTEVDYKVENYQILRIGRDPTEGFEIRSYPSLNTQWQIFEHCLAIYHLQRRK